MIKDWLSLRRQRAQTMTRQPRNVDFGTKKDDGDIDTRRMPMLGKSFAHYGEAGNDTSSSKARGRVRVHRCRGDWYCADRSSVGESKTTNLNKNKMAEVGLF